MTLQEILTYVEELAFKNSMFGYDKDEVDIQLDKICDEVEALVTQKDKEIENLKKKCMIVNATPDVQNGDVASYEESEPAQTPAGSDSDDMVSRAEYDAVVVECTQLKVALEKAQKELQAAKEEVDQSEEAAKMMIAQVESAQAMLTEAQEQAQDAEAQVKELQAKLAEAEAAPKAVEAEPVEEVQEIVPEEPKEEPKEETKSSIPQSTDAAYNQYMRYADLLCQQLAEVETKHSRIVDEATAEADQIRANAKTEADQIIADAQSAAEAKNTEAQKAAEEILSGAKAEAEALMEKAKTDAEDVGKEYMVKAIQAEEQCKELTQKKENLVASLAGFGEEITALLSKVKEAAE